MPQAPDLPSLVKLSDCYFDRLKWFSILVVIGVVFEGPEVVLEFVNLFRAKHKDSARWMKWIGLFGWLLVVIGVAGEGVYELRASRVEADIRTIEEGQLKETSRKAMAASIASANALTYAEQLNQQTKDLSERTKLEETRTIEVARAILPRVFTHADEVWLKTRIMECSPRHYNVRVFASPAGNLSEIVREALKGAGFPSVESVSTGIATSEVSINAPSAGLANCIRNALVKADIKPIGSVTRMDGGTIDIVIPIQYEGKPPSWSSSKAKCVPEKLAVKPLYSEEVLSGDTVERNYRQWISGGRKTSQLPSEPCSTNN